MHHTGGGACYLQVECCCSVHLLRLQLVHACAELLTHLLLCRWKGEGWCEVQSVVDRLTAADVRAWNQTLRLLSQALAPTLAQSEAAAAAAVCYIRKLVPSQQAAPHLVCVVTGGKRCSHVQLQPLLTLGDVCVQICLL